MNETLELNRPAGDVKTFKTLAGKLKKVEIGLTQFHVGIFFPQFNQLFKL